MTKMNTLGKTLDLYIVDCLDISKSLTQQIRDIEHVIHQGAGKRDIVELEDTQATISVGKKHRMFKMWLSTTPGKPYEQIYTAYEYEHIGALPDYPRLPMPLRILENTPIREESFILSRKNIEISGECKDDIQKYFSKVKYRLSKQKCSGGD